ncbi:unnamed protein product, partial [Ectocarpus sp. 12 AP-2014]
MKWEGAALGKKGTGTSGISKHLEICHKSEVDKHKAKVGASEDNTAPIVAALVGKSAAGPSAGAPSSSSLMNYMVPTMTKARKDAADRRFVLWCCIDLRPEQLRFDQGFKLFLGSLSPEYVTTTMAKSTFNQTLDELYGTVL